MNWWKCTSGNKHGDKRVEVNMESQSSRNGKSGSVQVCTSTACTS